MKLIRSREQSSAPGLRGAGSTGCEELFLGKHKDMGINLKSNPCACWRRQQWEWIILTLFQPVPPQDLISKHPHAILSKLFKIFKICLLNHPPQWEQLLSRALFPP